MTTDASTIRILHVDDEPEFAELATTYLERQDERFVVETVESASTALEQLKSNSIDCVVSDYDMPGRNGIELLASVREHYPDLPFILFTGMGSEEVASDAISAGVSDYLQKSIDTDQYAILANRINNVVAKHRAEEAVETTRRRFQRLIENSKDVITVVDAEGVFDYLSPAAKRVLGYEPVELRGENGFEKVHPDDVESTTAQFSAMVENPEQRPEVEFRFEQPDGSWRWLAARGRNLLDDPVVRGLVVNVRDVTERVERERELKASEERFRSIADTATDVIVTIDAESTIHFANQAVERVFGYAPSEVQGRQLTMLMPERYRDRHLDAIDRYLDTGNRHLDWTDVEMPGLHKEGDEFDLQISFAEVEIEGDHRFIGIIRA